MSIIAHMDMDAFFAAVEERENPYLRGLPIVVGADPLGGKGRGVVATANYTARAYGIHSALPIRRAWECSERARRLGKPPAVFLSASSGLYRKVSREIMKIARSFTRALEVTSVDEAYLDFSVHGSFAKARHAASVLKQAIKQQTHLTASVGIGPNQMIAKIASDFKKPDGLTVVSPDRAVAFLSPLLVRVMPGIGPKAEAVLRARGVITISDLQKLSSGELKNLFGKRGVSLYEHARGLGSSTVVSDTRKDPKSVGAHHTFALDTLRFDEVAASLSTLAKRVWRCLVQKEFAGARTVVVTVRFEDFETHTRSLTGSTPCKSLDTFERRALKLLIPFFESCGNPQKKCLRMVGIRAEKLLLNKKLSRLNLDNVA